MDRVGLTADQIPDFENVTIFGLGYFGLALLSHVERIEYPSFNITAYARSVPEVQAMIERGSHPERFPEYQVRQDVRLVSDVRSAVTGADLLIMATPSVSTREVFGAVAEHLEPGAVLLNTAKALDVETGQTLSRVVDEQLIGLDYFYALFAGGTTAHDLKNKQPLGADIASEDIEVAEKIAEFMQTGSLRLYPTEDLYGVEMASAMKNVVSVVAGFADGKGFDYGTETYVISKVAGSIGGICVERGAMPWTFGIGSQCWGNDMFMSATGDTRNRQFGRLLGQGFTVNGAIQKMKDEGKTVESVSTINSLSAHPELLQIPALEALYKLVVRGSIGSEDFKKVLLSY